MPQVAAVYGFDFIQPFSARGFDFWPAHDNRKASRKASRDTSAFRLCGVISAEKVSREDVFRLEAALTFIERLPVMISVFQESVGEPADWLQNANELLIEQKRHSGGGALLILLEWTRADFIDRILAKLDDDDAIGAAQFRVMFFKVVEAVRLRKPFVEVMYFLIWTGLESYCREVLKEEKGGAQSVIAKVLKSRGFNVYQERKGQVMRSILTFSQARNRLFHNGEREIDIDLGGESAHVKIADLLFPISQLTACLILKEVGYGDGKQLNWDSWVNRRPLGLPRDPPQEEEPAAEVIMPTMLGPDTCQLSAGAEADS